MIFTALSFAQVKIDYFRVFSDANGSIKIEWKTSQENNVKEFDLQRKTNETDWAPLNNYAILPHGPGVYDYTDDYASKRTSTTFSYRLIVHFNDGTTTSITSSPINQNVSGFKQTWGSIKAMFR